MEPLPETLRAIKELARYGDTEAATELLRIGREVRAIVPECVGVSLTLLADRFTFTLVAEGELTRELDAVQYVDDGPCIEAAMTDGLVETSIEELLDEDRWSLFAQAGAARGVCSSLSLPVVRHDRVVAGVNLYASTSDAFRDHHDELARICRAWQPGIVADADLTFATRQDAVDTPDRIADQDQVDLAVGMLASAQALGASEAGSRIREAAARAGVSESQVARIMIGVLGPQG
jgi:hypothetical protein